jgi:hypothetical protein
MIKRLIICEIERNVLFCKWRTILLKIMAHLRKSGLFEQQQLYVYFSLFNRSISNTNSLILSASAAIASDLF